MLKQMSAIQILKWLLISLNAENQRSASADGVSRVHHNTSKIPMFGKEYGSADTKDFIKVSGKSVQSDCLGHILNHLDTSLSNDFGVSRSSCHDSNCSEGGIPSLTNKDSIRLSQTPTGQQLSAKEWFCNCSSNISIKGMPTITLNRWNPWHFLFSTSIRSQLLYFVVPSQEFYTKSSLKH